MMRRIAAALALAGLVAAAGVAGSAGRANAAAAKTFEVGLVADQGELNDHGFNQLAYAGLLKAKHDLGVKGRVVESASPAEYIPNMVALARQGYDLIIGVGFAQGDAIAATAKKFPGTHFAIVDVDQRDLKGKPKNVVGLLFKEQQVGYIVGYLGALSAKRKGGKEISAVGGFKQPPVDRYIAGYRAGAERAVPGMKVTWGYSQDWDNQAKCKELALSQIAHGSAVVFQVAGGCGLGALDAAREKNVWGIGVDADQSFLGPYVLTSALKGVDAAVFLTIKSLVNGTFKGGRNSVFGLEQDGVGLGKVSPKANRADVKATLQVEKDIISGKIATIPTSLKS
jgi:basic membrane protein A and related proteins